jgi:hypothetical protein
MLIILMPRLDISHILSYRLDNRNYRSICGKTIIIDPTITTLAADNTYPGLCSNCRIRSDSYILDDLNYAPRNARNSFQEYFLHLRDFIKDEMLGPENKYFYLCNRNWSKLKKLKLKV